MTPKSYLCLEGWKDTCSRKHKSWEGGTMVRETAKVSQAEEDTEAKSPSHTPPELWEHGLNVKVHPLSAAGLTCDVRICSSSTAQARYKACPEAQVQACKGTRWMRVWVLRNVGTSGVKGQVSEVSEDLKFKPQHVKWWVCEAPKFLSGIKSIKMI